MVLETVTKAYFIKLGQGGRWERECIDNGTLRFGYHEIPHEACALADWEAVLQNMLSRGVDRGAATRHLMQIKVFYEAGEETILITFHGGRMYWSQPAGVSALLPDRGKTRETMNGWRGESAGGTPLTMDKISGKLLRVQGFQGTICEVKEKEYLLRKLRDEASPQVAAAIVAEELLLDAIIGLLRLLTWQDFELLIDLIFSNSGWRRGGQVGKTQKTIDLELVLPTTGERAFVQIKSEASTSTLRAYEGALEVGRYERMFFVWHTGPDDLVGSLTNVSLWGPRVVARMVLDAGLSTWLREKVS